MGIRTIRKSFRIGDDLRPTITADSVHNLSSRVIRTIFEGIAVAKHYKTLYTIQKEKNLNLNAAVKLFFTNDEYMQDVEKFLKDDANYRDVFKSAIQNFGAGFTEDDIPLRDCDFKVEENEACSWFYIEERVEINFSGIRFYINRLIIDPKSNVIVYSGLDENDWENYAEEGPVGQAYKSFLADRELLN